jgi:hypothetical protein
VVDIFCCYRTATYVVVAKRGSCPSLDISISVCFVSEFEIFIAAMRKV